MILAQRVLKSATRVGLYATLLGILGLSLVACGDELAQPTPFTPANTSAPAPPQGTPKSANEIQIILTEWGGIPANMGIPSGKTRFKVTNNGTEPHNLTISSGDKDLGKTIDFKKEDGPQTLELDLQPGTYKMWSSIPGQAEKGLIGTLTVGQ